MERDETSEHSPVEYRVEEWFAALGARRALGEGACMALVNRGGAWMLRVFGSRSEFTAFDEVGVRKHREPIRELSLSELDVKATMRIKKSCGGSLYGNRIFSSQEEMLEHANELGHTFFITMNHLRRSRIRGSSPVDPKGFVSIDGHRGAFCNVYAFSSFASEVEWFEWEKKLLQSEKLCFERVMNPEKAPAACGRVRPFFDMDSKGAERGVRFPVDAIEALDVLETRMWSCVVKHATAVARDWWGLDLTLEKNFRIGVTCEAFRAYKLSNHIIVMGMGSVTMDGALAFALEVKRRAAAEDQFSASTIDESVYSSGQNLRMVGHCKTDSPGRFVRPHPLFERSSARDFLLHPTAEELQSKLDLPEGVMSTRSTRARDTDEEEPASKKHKTESRSADVCTVQSWLDAGGVYAGEEVQKVSRNPAYPDSVTIFFKKPVHCHHIGRPHCQNAQHVSLVIRGDGSVVQFCRDDNNGCKDKPPNKPELRVSADVLDALWPENSDFNTESMSIDVVDPDDPTEPPIRAVPDPKVLPAFRKTAYDYIIQTQFVRHEETTVQLRKGKLPKIKKIEITDVERQKMVERMNNNMERLLEERREAREKAKKDGGIKRDRAAEARQERAIQETVRFEQRLKSNGTYCPNLGAPHSTPTSIGFTVKWYAPIEMGEIKFGTRLRCTISLTCSDPRCQNLKCYVNMSEDAEHYASYKEKHERGGFRVLFPRLMFGFEGPTEVSMFTPRAFMDQYVNFPNVFDLPFTSVYAKDPGARTYSNMDIFPPGATVVCPDGTYNMWRGFAASKLPSQKNPAEPTMFLDTVRRVFGDEHFKFVIDHMAWMIQKPGKRTDIMLIAYGLEGCGKNAIYDRALGRIMGSSYYAYSFNPEALTEKHSELNNGKILIVFDDFSPQKGRKVAEELKSRSTSEKVTYERKGIQSVQLTNYSNLVFLTNKLNALSFKGDQRRTALLECRNDLVGDAAYWTDYEAWIDEPNNIRSIYDFFMARDLSKVSLRWDRPKTEILKDQQFNDLEPELHFLYEHMQKTFDGLRIDPEGIAESGIDPKTFLTSKWSISNKEFATSYSAWWSRQNFPATKNQKNGPQLGTWLKYKIKVDGGFANDVGRKHGSTYNFDNNLLVPFMVKKGFSFNSMIDDSDTAEVLEVGVSRLVQAD